MTTIPKFQLDPPAGHEDAIAYRPACEQLTPRFNPRTELTDWGLTLPSGEFYILRSIPPQSPERSYASLDAAGICKNKGVIVPIVSPQQAVAGLDRPVLQNVPAQSQNFPVGMAISAGLAIAAIAYLIYGYLSRKSSVDEGFSQFIGGGE